MQILSLPDSRVSYLPNFLPKETSDKFLELFLSNLAWEQGFIQLFGIKPEPRLSCWYGEPEAVYTYSKKTMNPLPWTPALLSLKEMIENQTNEKFNCVLGNLYRDGNDSMGWHSDDEAELGKNPVIASISLGETRKFRFKHKSLKRNTHTILLEHGSLLLMAGTTQDYWLHQIPKEQNITKPRLNFTFRKILHKSN